ncbi:cupredoxin domain-containing protein [Natrarchaeobius chitinivorans]|uniref:Halocyanin n=1 Tax=Natrarchaeobius chitinivorans TaxID=1679083 RepID=A0A3N6M3X5_NATCH|nr:plastocyanin/azurin family copper-binding protein [Natrarchaeobius chitinivorans]RQG96657.1 halocyanin [Natrarchaeobius chitinivorans]
MNRRVYLAAVGTAASSGLAGCTSILSAFESEPCDGESCDIGMTRNEFVPVEYETTVGEPVVWKNTSGADHTVTALENTLPDGAAYFATGDYEDEETARSAWHEYRGGYLGTRETYEHTFEVPGRYDYICEPHVKGGMVGTVIVTE